MPWSRKKSCERCRASKARCNQATPACSRCSERQFQCIYDRPDTHHAARYPYSPRPSPFVNTLGKASPRTILSSQPGLNSEDTFAADQFFTIGVDEAMPDFGQHLDWNTIDPLGDTDLAATKVFELPDLDYRQQTMVPQNDSLPDHTLPAIYTDIPTTIESATTSGPQFPQDSGGVSILKQTSGRMTLAIEQSKGQRALMRRGAHKACPLTSIVLGQITSYPEMMIVGEQLPPFIHPPCHIDEELAQDCAESGKHQCLPKDLAVCASLVQMFCQRTAANASFGWKLIYEEVERLRKEYHNLPRQERLTALQSTTVFLILQAKDSDSAAKNGVGSLIATVTEMTLDLTRNYDWHLEIPQGRPDRREWVFRESLRRIIALLSIIDLLLEGVIMATANSCHDFTAVPLPSTRTLWGARTNRGWRTEHAKYTSKRKSNTVLTIRDLIESDDAGCFTNSKNNIRNTEVFSDVIKWCEGLDTLGSLIWMVLPFEQYRRRNLGSESW